MKKDLTWSTSYELEYPTEVSTSAKVYYYPVSTNGLGTDGVLCKITNAEARVFFAQFAYGKLVRNGYSGLFALPSSNNLLCVSNGAAYFLNTLAPENCTKVVLAPIIDVIPLADQKLILLIGQTSIAAHDGEKYLWQTKRISFDSLQVIDLNHNKIFGQYEDIGNDTIKKFEIDLETGSVMGGVPFD